MLLTRFWRYIRGQRHRVSFYDSTVMRQAVETAGPVNMAWLTNEALEMIVQSEPHSLRAEAAHHELEMRAIRARESSGDGPHIMAH